MAFIMKIIVVIILVYAIYLNTKQANLLRSVISSNNEKAQSQLNMNIICGYIFTIFIVVLLIYVIKSFF